MTAEELRKKYLDFFRDKGHAVIPSASLIPENDPSVLFTAAGMHPLVPYLAGEKHSAGQRLVNCQKCARTTDIDEVGDVCHHTFFEMLGNWSLGDYFKKEAIEWSWEFLTGGEWLGLDKKRLAVSVFAGDNDAPFDQEAFEAWKNLGVAEARIAKLPKKNNWWGLVKGPCGPDTEMFYWIGDGEAPTVFDADNDSWVEIWNDVFMQFDKKEGGALTPLAQKNVDTGMGLERALAVANGFDDDYRTELFWPLIQKIEEISGKRYDESAAAQKSMRIIADHIKSAVFILGDEKAVAPSNIGAGYVLRRLIRRAARHGRQLEIKQCFIAEIAQAAVGIYESAYPELRRRENFIVEQLAKEEKKFAETLEQGLKKFEKLNREPIIAGEQAFNLYQTYGFPIEITEELASERRQTVDKAGFANELKKHQELSRSAAAGMFKGGLADNSEQTVKYHTAAHLMLAALRQILGAQVAQKGSNITAERLRFDFSYPAKMTPEQIRLVENLVNEKIREDASVVCEEMDLSAAKAAGALGAFESKYGDKVKVYSIGDFSKEICGGPHIESAGRLGRFRILKEEASSTGVRRIKAVLE